MGIQLSKHLSTGCSGSMAEAPDSSLCQCATSPSSSTSTCTHCQPMSSNFSSQNSESASTSCRTNGGPQEGISSKRTFCNLSLGGRKTAKSKDKAEKPAKSKMSWTLRWRLKSPQISEQHQREPMIDLNRFNPADFPIEDKDEAARRARAREIAEGIEMEIESLPPSYRTVNDGAAMEAADASCVSRSLGEAEAPSIVEAGSASESVSQQEAAEAMAMALQPNLSASVIEGLTVLLHRSLVMDSQRAWNVLTHGDLHFLVQHFHWHQHQHGPEVLVIPSRCCSSILA